MKISIVTPTFNRVDSIKQNIKSIMSQQVPIYEHIIVDNCSEDGTEEYIRDYRKSASWNVVYIREHDTGIYNAMNKGVAAASGDWIHILNSDDYLVNENAYKSVMTDNVESYDMIMASIIHKNRDGKEELWIPKEDEWRIPHPGMIIKKEYYNKVGLYSERFRIVSDAIWKFKNIPRAKYKIVEKPLTVMTLGGVSTQKSRNYYWENFLCVFFYQPLPLVKKIKLSWKHLKKYFKAVFV